MRPAASRRATGDGQQQLVKVSDDPTWELYRALNPLFVAACERQTGQRWTVTQSHGGSSQQARKVIAGQQPAHVVTLGLPSEIGALRKHGLVAADWAGRLPNRSGPTPRRSSSWSAAATRAASGTGRTFWHRGST